MKKLVLILTLLSASASANTPALRFTQNGTNVVHDAVTGLDWQQSVPTPMGAGCAAPGPDVGRCNYVTAASYCAALALGTGTWRLPTVHELASLLDVKSSQDYASSGTKSLLRGLDATVNPDYWTRTAQDATRYVVTFKLDASVVSPIRAQPETDKAFIRCVKP